MSSGRSSREAIFWRWLVSTAEWKLDPRCIAPEGGVRILETYLYIQRLGQVIHVSTADGERCRTCFRTAEVLSEIVMTRARRDDRVPCRDSSGNEHRRAERRGDAREIGRAHV